MAAPTDKIRRAPREQGAERQAELEEVLDVLVRHKGALLELLEILQLLQDRGLLRLLKGLLAAGGEVLHDLVSAADTPGGRRLLSNLSQTGLLLTRLDVGRVREAVDQAAVDRSQKARIRDLLKEMKDPETLESLLWSMETLKAARSGIRMPGEGEDGERKASKPPKPGARV